MEPTGLANVVATPHIGLDRKSLTMLHTVSQGDHLFASFVSDDETGDYHVSEPGWYALDDGEHVVLGPFASLRECEREIRDHDQLTPKTI